MAMLKVSCPHCGTPTRIDSARLPDHLLRLPCPSCQGELVLDKAKLLGAATPGPVSEETLPPLERSTAPAPASTGQSMRAPDLPPIASTPSPSPPTPIVRTPRPAAVADGVSSSGSRSLLPPNFSIPAGTVLPAGIMVGDDVATMATLRDSLETWGGRLDVLAGPDAVRELDRLPELQVIVMGQVGVPPNAFVAAFVDLPARQRRRTFVVLVASDVKTLDGNQAFLHQVDLVLNKRDLDRAAELVFAALDYRNRLYAPLLAAEESADEG